jgi:hypothetical protein
MVASAAILPDNMDPCGKVWYATLQEAEKKAATMKSNRGANWILNAYYCYVCDGFHVGHTKKSRKEKINGR